MPDVVTTTGRRIPPIITNVPTSDIMPRAKRPRGNITANHIPAIPVTLQCRGLLHVADTIKAQLMENSDPNPDAPSPATKRITV